MSALGTLSHSDRCVMDEVRVASDVHVSAGDIRRGWTILAARRGRKAFDAGLGGCAQDARRHIGERLVGPDGLSAWAGQEGRRLCRPQPARKQLFELPLLLTPFRARSSRRRRTVALLLVLWLHGARALSPAPPCPRIPHSLEPSAPHRARYLPAPRRTIHLCARFAASRMNGAHALPHIADSSGLLFS